MAELVRPLQQGQQVKVRADVRYTLYKGRIGTITRAFTNLRPCQPLANRGVARIVAVRRAVSVAGARPA